MDADRYTRLEIRVDQIKDDLAELKADAKIKTQQMEELRDALKEHTATIKEHIAGDNKIIDKILPVFDALRDVQRIVPVVEKIAPIVEKIAPIVERMHPVVDKIHPVVEKITPIADSYDDIKTIINTYRFDKQTRIRRAIVIKRWSYIIGVLGTLVGIAVGGVEFFKLL